MADSPPAGTPGKSGTADAADRSSVADVAESLRTTLARLKRELEAG